MPPDTRDYLEDEEYDPFFPDDPPSPLADETVARKRLRIRLIVILFSMILCVEIGASMNSAPTTRIYEAITCQRYYEKNDKSKIGPDGDIPEELCKNGMIQGEIALVKGYAELFDALVGVLLAIPYAMLADRRGRKPVIILSIPGFLVHMFLTANVLWFSNIFPLRMIWLTSVAWFLGGGLVVAGATVWTMMADVTSDAQRAAIFFQFGVATMGSDFVASAISAWLMTYNPWIPMFLGWGFIVIGVLPALALPETLSAFPSTKPAQPTHELADLPPDEVEHGPARMKWQSNDTFITALRLKLRSSLSAFEFLVQDKQLLLLLCTFLVFKLSRGTAWFLVQYISKRYNWTIAKANFLVSLKSISTIILFTVILPGLSWYLVSKRKMHTRQKDLLLTKASVIFLMLGTLGIGLAPSISPMVCSLFIQTLGGGFVFVARSLVTTLVNRDQTARLYTVIEILQAVGSIVAGPTIAAFFKWGLELGGPWIGLPWMVSSGLFLVTATAVWTYRMPPMPKQDRGETFE